MNNEKLSNCCGATVHVHSEGTTHYYICDKCDMACDLKTNNGEPKLEMNNDWKERLQGIRNKVDRQETFIMFHLRSDTDDFTGYHTTSGINEDSFHIPFNEILKDIDGLEPIIQSEIDKAYVKGHRDCADDITISGEGEIKVLTPKEFREELDKAKKEAIEEFENKLLVRLIEKKGSMFSCHDVAKEINLLKGVIK